MKRYNICTAKTYEKDGETKKAWRTVGQLIEWPERRENDEKKPRSFSVELHMFPATRFSVFEEKAREEKQGGDGEGSDF